MSGRRAQLSIALLCALVLGIAAAPASGRHHRRGRPNASACAGLERMIPKRFAAKAHHRHHRHHFNCRIHAVASHAGRPLVFHRGTGTAGPLPPQAIPDHPPVVIPLHRAPLRLARRSRRVTIISLGGRRTAHAAKNYPAAFENGVKLYNTQPVAANPIGAGNNGSETSEADGDGVIFYAGNFFAAYSNTDFFSNGTTASFVSVDPRSVPANPPAGMQFCCDQVVQFIPQVHLFVWVIQYVNGFRPTRSVIRVAVASPESILAGGNTPGAWAYTDLVPSQVNRGGD